MARLEILHLAKEFGGRAAVDDVSFEVKSGELCVLLGPSGCGKSTTLRLIAGLDMPDGGTIKSDGAEITDVPAKDRHIAMVFQSYALFPHLTVGENIIFGLRVRKVARHERDTRLADVAALTGLTDYLDRKPDQLSGGQRQRVALARAIVGHQPLCLMDEPLSNLDAKLRHEMRIEIRALQQRLGVTMVYVTHDQIEAMTMADSVILMNQGRVEQAGPPSDLYEQPASVFAARFIGSPPMNIIETGPLSGEDYVVGIRAEHVVLGEASGNGHDFEAASIEYLGADTVISFRAAGPDRSLVQARVAGRSALRVGERAGLHWPPNCEHRFDRASGRRL